MATNIKLPSGFSATRGELQSDIQRLWHHSCGTVLNWMIEFLCGTTPPRDEMRLCAQSKNTTT
ncbi:uncharacterized protein FOMMEDRAFT_150798 [Fomitiporia mediterranea MF3/22]|uniref:uncharacterized protein n=1 Tax=Fomitiporia mediterranea (strain MF3/22) TaxID=694068 RepID=UPI0004407A75|nr:uncharacterized protein FOMMEDRAFT_150798 [Fomitiporia mediterranea MF3/22]EJD08113.1 hypothetical protein FOMMEDRAFT_150798 [Fomitiporia mediterranea MF3/22]